MLFEALVEFVSGPELPPALSGYYEPFVDLLSLHLLLGHGSRARDAAIQDLKRLIAVAVSNNPRAQRQQINDIVWKEVHRWMENPKGKHLPFGVAC